MENSNEKNKLIELSKMFAVDIVNLCADIKENRKGNVLLNQLLRSGTSIGANIHEANYASSKADFINKYCKGKSIILTKVELCWMVQK